MIERIGIVVLMAVILMWGTPAAPADGAAEGLGAFEWLLGTWVRENDLGRIFERWERLSESTSSPSRVSSPILRSTPSSASSCGVVRPVTLNRRAGVNAL